MNTNTKELNMKELDMNELEQASAGILPVLIFGGLAVEAGVLVYVGYELMK